MPYYIFKYENSSVGKLKPLEKLAEFTVFKDASKYAKSQRAELPQLDDTTIKVVFGENELVAEEELRKKREPRPAGEDF